MALQSPALLSKIDIDYLEATTANFPFYADAHIALAKKYQLENHPNYEAQLQKAALYCFDRNKLYQFIEKQDFSYNDDEAAKEVQIEMETDSEVTVEQIVSKESDAKVESSIAESKPETVLESASTTNAIQENSGEIKQEVIEEAENTQKIPEAKTSLVNQEKSEPEITPEAPSPLISHDYQEQARQQAKASPKSFSEWLQSFSAQANNITAQAKHADLPVSHEVPMEPAFDYFSSELTSLPTVQVIDELRNKITTLPTPKLEDEDPTDIEDLKIDLESVTQFGLQQREEFVTETMAKIYEMQGNTDKAIEVYEKLSLRMPEKSAYFASLISKIKNL